MSPIVPLSDWKGRFVSTLEALVFMRSHACKGVDLDFFIGKTDVQAFVAFINGMHFQCFCQGQQDVQYIAFVDWLRDVCKEFPAEGWQEDYLAKAAGDHHAAIMRFLDRCAEFVATVNRV